MFKKVSFLVLAIILTLGLVACSDDNKQDDKPNETENNDNQNNDNQDEDNNNNSNNKENNNADNEENDKNDDQGNDTAAIGDTINYDGLEVTLNEVRFEEGGDFDTPDNDQFLVANLTVENTTDEEKLISSLIYFELKDDEGYSYSATFLIEGTKGQLDGSIPAGDKLRGEIVFDVSDSDEYKLHFDEPFSTGKATWIFSNDEIN